MNFLNKFSKNTPISNFTKIHLVGASVFNVDGQTDVMKLIVLFCNFVNTPKKQHLKVLQAAFWEVFSEPWLILFKLSESSQTLEKIKYTTNIYIKIQRGYNLQKCGLKMDKTCTFWLIGRHSYYCSTESILHEELIGSFF